MFFLHDGRTNDLLQAILAQYSNAEAVTVNISLLGGNCLMPCTDVTQSYPASEANAVIQQFKGLSISDQQAILDFLRSL